MLHAPVGLCAMGFAAAGLILRGIVAEEEGIASSCNFAANSLNFRDVSGVPGTSLAPRPLNPCGVADFWMSATQAERASRCRRDWQRRWETRDEWPNPVRILRR